jgi:sialic acid synthase SpsE
MVWHNQPMEREIAPIEKMGQSLYWARTLPVGKMISRDDIAIQSPRCSNGIWPTPIHLSMLIGRKLGKPIQRGQLISWDQLFRRQEK